MKKYIGILATALLVGCTNHFLPDGMADLEKVEQKSKSVESPEIKALLNQARWGSGKAYLELANRYRDGVGVRQDFMGMISMVEMAHQHGSLKNKESYFDSIPEDNDFRIFGDIIKMSSHDLREDKDSLLTLLSAIELPDAVMVQGLLYIECGDTINGMECLRQARDNGSALAELALLFTYSKRNSLPDEEEMLQIADRAPIVYQLMGKQCLSDNSESSKRKAAQYFMKAEEHALLSRRNASWLLAYYKCGGDILLTEEDVHRLESFVRIPESEAVVTMPD